MSPAPPIALQHHWMKGDPKGQAFPWIDVCCTPADTHHVSFHLLARPVVPTPQGSVFIQTRDSQIHLTAETVLFVTLAQPKKRKDESIWTAEKNTDI